MIRASLSIGSHADALLLVAAIGLVEPPAELLAGAAAPACFADAAETLLAVWAGAPWTADAAAILRDAREAANDRVPGTWHILPPGVADPAQARLGRSLDLTAPVRWGAEWTAAEVARAGLTSWALWRQLAALEAACDARHAALQRAHAGEPVAELPDLAAPCAALFAELSRWQPTVSVMVAAAGAPDA